MDDLVRRAIAGYYRSPGPKAQPDHELSGAVTLDGKRYVVLRNADGVITVFRVAAKRGELRQMRRPPKSLLDQFTSRRKAS